MRCVPLTISYHNFILCISKVSNMLHHRSMGQVHGKDKNPALYWYTYTFLAFFFILHQIFAFLSFLFLFFHEVSNFRNRILTTHQKLEIYRWYEIISVTALMGCFRKKNIRRGVEDMKFPGVLKNKMWKFQGPRKGIYRGDQEKTMWNFHESRI